MANDKVNKPGQTRVSPMNTHLRDMQADAFKRAQEKKVWDQMQKQARDNQGNGSY